MGQKVNPIGLRLGIVKTWDSRWFSEKNYADYIFEDHKLRKYIKKKLNHAGIAKIPMAVDHHHDGETVIDKNAGHEEDHREHEGLDPHIWLSPALVKVQAKTILAALQDIDPSHKAAYESNYRQFVSRISQLDDNLKRTFSNNKGFEFMVFHPAWGYFAQAYDLKQVPIEIEGKNPKPAQLRALIEHARERGISVII